MADSEEADLATQLAAWSKPSRVHSKDELPHLAKIGEVCKAFLHQNANAFVARLGDRSLLMTYSGDGTPISTRVNIFASSSSNTILRAGKQSAEYYVHNVILAAYDVVSGRISCVVLEIRGR